MNKIITISGELGSGKSTVSKQLAKLSGARRYSVGDIQRQMAEARGISTVELNIISEKDRSIDRELDSALVLLRDVKEDLVVDARLGWFFLPESVKIRLLVSPEEAARRVFVDVSRISETTSTIEGVRSSLSARSESEMRRYKKYYGIDICDVDNFDYAIDTTGAKPESVAILIEALAGGRMGTNKFWVMPQNLYPNEDIRILSRNDAKDIRKSIDENGFDFSRPITAVKSDHDYFIYRGHKRTSGAIFAGIAFVPVEFVEGHVLVNISRFYDWEAAHNFSYGRYPVKPIRGMSRVNNEKIKPEIY